MEKTNVKIGIVDSYTSPLLNKSAMKSVGIKLDRQNDTTATIWGKQVYCNNIGEANILDYETSGHYCLPP